MKIILKIKINDKESVLKKQIRKLDNNCRGIMTLKFLRKVIEFRY